MLTQNQRRIAIYRVTLAKIPGSADTRLANIGNKLLAAMGLKMLLDYPGKRITFYGKCPD